MGTLLRFLPEAAGLAAFLGTLLMGWLFNC